MTKLFVHVDGGSRGNPGQAAVGLVLTDEHGVVVEEWGQRIGRATNNVAAYKALIEGIRRSLAHNPEEAVFLTDNHLVANQVNGLRHTREPHLQHLNLIARGLLEQLPKWRVNHIERDANSAARRLTEQAFREQLREERERRTLCAQAEALLRELPVEQLRNALTHIRSLRPRGP